MRPTALLTVLLYPAFCASAGASTLACSATVSGSPEATDAEVNPSSTAVVVVERTLTTGTTVSAPDDVQASAVARFVRMRSGPVDDDALRMVGAAVAFPALGTCVAAPPSAGTNTARAVELLDVGAISLEVNGLRTDLQARQLPDVVDLVSGFVYATRATDADAFPARGVYELRVSGSTDGDLASFLVSASAPDDLTSLRVAGQSADASVTFTPDASVDLAWDAGAADDFVYVDVAGDSEAQPSTRCLFTDSGQATLPLSAFADGWTDGTLTLHRVHREPFRVRSLDSGEIRFDFARAVSFRRR